MLIIVETFQPRTKREYYKQNQGVFISDKNVITFTIIKK